MTPSDELEDILIQQIIGGNDPRTAMSEFERIGEGRPEVWEQLARSFHDQQFLKAAAAHGATAASRVDLELQKAPVPYTSGAGRSTLQHHRATTLSGWLAAAAVLIVAVIHGAAPAASPQPPSHEVLGELPNILVETSNIGPGAGRDIIYIRRTVEKMRVNNLFEFQRDDAGAIHGIPTALGRISGSIPL